MLKRIILTGFGTGLVAAAGLFYPLYICLPAGIVPGWQAGSAQLAGLLVALAALIVAAGGGLVVWWNGDSRMGRRVVSGALAGVLAGYTAYGLIGAAAAGVLASGAMFASVADEATFTGNLANSIIGTVWSVHAAFWGMALAGALLGGIGGLLAPVKSSSAAPEASTDEVVMANIAAIAAMLASGLALIVTIAIFALLPGSLREASQTSGMRLVFPPETVSFWPVATVTALFVASQVAATATLRAVARRAENSRSLLANSASSAAVVSLLPVGILIIQLLLAPGAILSPAFLPGLVVSLIVAATLIPLARDLFRQAKTAPDIETDRPMAMLRRNLLPVMLGSTLGIVLPGYGTVLPVALSLVLIQVVQVGRFYDTTVTLELSPASMVNGVFQVHAGSFGVLIAASAVLSLAGTGLLILISRLLTRKETGTP